MTTLWRMCFSKFIGKRCGHYYAMHECGELNKPSLLIQTEDNPQSQWKLRSLNHIYDKNRAKFASKLKKKECSKLITTSFNCSTNEICEYVTYIETKKKYQECCYKFRYHLFNLSSYFHDFIQMFCSEEFWKFVHMTAMTVYGCTVIYDAAYFYDTSLLYIAWPQPYSPEMELYHILSIGYHGHRALWQIFDTKRKDFWVQCVYFLFAFLILCQLIRR